MLTNGTFWAGVIAGLVVLWAWHKYQARNSS